MAAAERAGGPTLKPQVYRSFLIRCRLEEGAGPAGEPAWRFTVQQAEANAPRRSFTSLQAVAAYLEAVLTSCTAFAQQTLDKEKTR